MFTRPEGCERQSNREALLEPPGVPRRVPERQPEYLRVAVRQGPFRDLPYRVVDGARLVEDYDDPLPLVVQPRERLSVVLVPYGAVEPPGRLVPLLPSGQGRRRKLEPVPGDKAVAPLCQLRPSLRLDSLDRKSVV